MARRRPDRPDRVFDEGLQQERTALAWDRTALAMLASGLVYARAVGPPYVRVAHLPVAVALGVGAAMLLLGARRYADLHATLRADRPVQRVPYVRAVWLGTVVVGLASTVAVVFA
ncbi:MAG: DUF202 domain-containing protein [Actinobacteria bacterium]|nr:DUF202 domain-containing protein [Actinomycetota bacterium]